MNNVLLIKRDNKKGREVMKKLHEAKESLRAYIAAGGSVKNYTPKKKNVA